jgi:hypothetical protein
MTRLLRLAQWGSALKEGGPFAPSLSRAVTGLYATVSSRTPSHTITTSTSFAQANPNPLEELKKNLADG